MSESAESDWVENLPPAPQTMSEQERKEQEKRVAKAMSKILSRMPIQELIKTIRNETENRGH